MALGILCAGQGTQYRTMFRQLLAEPSLAPQLSQLAQHLNLPITTELSWPEASLYDNQTAQALIAGHTHLSWQALSRLVTPPMVFIGYSLGELSAYACANSFDFNTLLLLAKQRAHLMDQACSQPSGLVSIKGLRKANIDVLCQQTACYIAIENGPMHYLIGGLNGALKQFLGLAEQAAGFEKATPLKVNVASHTPLLASATPAFSALLDRQNLSPPRIPILAGIDARRVRTCEAMNSTLSEQISQPIYFAKCLCDAVELGVSVFLEIGPGQSLAHILKALDLPVAVKSLDDFSSFAGAAAWVEARLLASPG